MTYVAPAAAPLIRPEKEQSGLVFAFVLGLVLFGSTTLAAAVGLLARWSALAEITTHFRAWYAVCAMISLAILLITRHWRWSLAAAVLVAWHGVPVALWYLPAPGAEAASGAKITVLTANVNADTGGYDRMLTSIGHEEPDLIFIQELSPAWAKALEALHEEYPHRIISARLDYFGLGLYSRFPIENSQSNDPLNGEVPISRADVIVEGRRLHVLNLHLAPPEGRALTALRYKQFAWLTDYLASVDGPVIAAGDFNCTMWSPLYRDLVSEGDLANARQGHGILASWFRLVGRLHVIPIDQILGGGGVAFTEAHLGTPMGSDHCPLVAELRLPD